jgi:hypothetical protein
MFYNCLLRITGPDSAAPFKNNIHSSASSPKNPTKQLYAKHATHPHHQWPLSAEKKW